MVERAAEGLADLTEVTSVLDDAAAVDVDARPGARDGTFFMGVAVVGVGERSGRSATGVGGGEMNATFLCTSTMIVVLSLVGLRAFLSNSLLLDVGIGVCVGVGVELGVCDAVLESMFVFSSPGSSMTGNCLFDSSGRGLNELLELGRGCC